MRTAAEVFNETFKLSPVKGWVKLMAIDAMKQYAREALEEQRTGIQNHFKTRLEEYPDGSFSRTAIRSLEMSLNSILSIELK